MEDMKSEACAGMDRSLAKAVIVPVLGRSAKLPGWSAESRSPAQTKGFFLVYGNKESLLSL